MCGENALGFDEGGGHEGSSPRVRGKLHGRLLPCALDGLIPACAGKTMVMVVSPAISWAHPRVCGENPWTASRSASSCGSSPRVRGKRARDCLHADHLGLIPACAGKTDRYHIFSFVCGAHPRVCGENTGRRRGRPRAPGSSPRVRGKHPESHGEGPALRLIPACAGKTDCPGAGTTWRGAHPRVCGENAPAGSPGTRSAGSSPRVRGKRTALKPAFEPCGLIPACAGKTTPATHTTSGRRAHPRVCGEN